MQELQRIAGATFEIRAGSVTQLRNFFCHRSDNRVSRRRHGRLRLVFASSFPLPLVPRGPYWQKKQRCCFMVPARSGRALIVPQVVTCCGRETRFAASARLLSTCIAPKIEVFGRSDVHSAKRQASPAAASAHHVGKCNSPKRHRLRPRRAFCRLPRNQAWCFPASARTFSRMFRAQAPHVCHKAIDKMRRCRCSNIVAQRKIRATRSARRLTRS
jgi:hypothetical protein